MCYYVYALIAESVNRIYVGFSTDIERRIKESNAGKTKSTKAYRTWSLLYKEKVVTRQEARAREKYLKSGVGKEFLKKMHKSPVAQLDTCLPAGREQLPSKQ